MAGERQQASNELIHSRAVLAHYRVDPAEPLDQNRTPSCILGDSEQAASATIGEPSWRDSAPRLAVNRCYGAMTRGRGEEFREALDQVGMFARVYECIAAKAGPIRLFHIPGFVDRESAPPSE